VLTLEDARRIAAAFVEHYNTVRLDPAIDYATHADMMAGGADGVHSGRGRKLVSPRARTCQAA
jgi:hypothetical protein